ncbi:hypothetical protein PQX77_006922, partial [Marasmius sp. AFHP31]
MELPQRNTIVVFSIDPVTTVEHLEDIELVEACRKLSCKKYIAMVGMRGQPGFWLKRPYHTYEFKLVYQGLRKKDKKKCIKPEMSVPILPNTRHPLSRQPLEPSIPLPWQDCYVSHLFGGSARCRSIMLKEKPTHIRELQSTNALQSTLLMDEDRRTQKTKLNPAQEAQCIGLGDSMDDDSAELDHDSEDDPEQEEFELIMSMIDREKLKRENPDREFYEVLLEAMAKVREDLGLPPDGENSTETASAFAQDTEMYQLPVFNVSYDLSEVDCVNDPEDFYEELRAIRRLTAQYEEARMQQQIEKARQIDEEYFANKSHGPVTGPVLHKLTGGTARTGRVPRSIPKAIRPLAKGEEFLHIVNRHRIERVLEGPTMSPPPPHLENLPLELLTRIGESLLWDSRLALASTSSNLRGSLAPFIFSSIKVTSNTQGGQDLERLADKYGSFTARLHFVASMPNGTPSDVLAPTGNGVPDQDDPSSRDSADTSNATQRLITDLAHNVLTGKLLPNVTTLCLSFDFDFDTNGKEQDGNVWDDPNWITDDSTSIYVFTDAEAADDVKTKEAKYPWRKPRLLIRTTGGTFLGVWMWGGDNGAGWEVNTLEGYMAYEARLGEYFFRHLNQVQKLLFVAYTRSPFGATEEGEGDDVEHDVAFPLLKEYLPRLRSLEVHNIFVSKRLADFVL